MRLLICVSVYACTSIPDMHVCMGGTIASFGFGGYGHHWFLASPARAARPLIGRPTMCTRAPLGWWERSHQSTYDLVEGAGGAGGLEAHAHVLPDRVLRQLLVQRQVLGRKQLLRRDPHLDSAVGPKSKITVSQMSGEYGSIGGHSGPLDSTNPAKRSRVSVHRCDANETCALSA